MGCGGKPDRCCAPVRFEDTTSSGTEGAPTAQRPLFVGGKPTSVEQLGEALS
jgi:hypothetical protein